VHRIHSRANSDLFCLARFPETGPDHSEDCIYYGVDPGMSGLAGYRRGVVQELDDGKTKIKLKVGLQERPTTAPEEESSAAGAEKKMATARARAGQASMTLLGLLHYLWTESGFNVWAPSMNGKRGVGVVHYYLLRVASSTFVSRVRLASNLVIAISASDGQQAALNKTKSTDAMNRRRLLVAVAPLAQYQPGMETAGRLPIMGFHAPPRIL